VSTVAGQSAGRQRLKRRIGTAAAGIDAISTTRTAPLIGLAAAVVIGLVGSLTIIATPAAAAVPGLIRVSATTSSTSQDAKDVAVSCPAGKQLVGTGARIDGGLGEVVLTALQPNGSPTVAPTSVLAIAREADPISGNWSLTVYGICANPLPGLVRISATSSASQSEDLKSVGARCPAGKALVGTGFQIAGGHGQVTVVFVLPYGPNPSDPMVGVFAAEVDLYYDNWRLTAYAICAIPPAGLRVYEARSANNSADSKTVVAHCPPLMGLLGTGLDSWGSYQKVLDDVAPNGGPTTAPTSVSVTQYEEDATAEPWTIVAYAICANLWK
jgi:hypothetical protein